MMEIKHEVDLITTLVYDCSVGLVIHEKLGAEDVQLGGSYLGFYGYMRKAILNYLLLQCAKLFDTDARAVSLHRCAEHSKELSHLIQKHGGVIHRLQLHRNQRVAHSDEVPDPLLSREFPTEEFKSLISNLETVVENIRDNIGLKPFDFERKRQVAREDTFRALTALQRGVGS